MKLRLAVKMGQRLVMTPAMQQAIKLLPLTRLELIENIRQELDENPFLEEEQPEPQELESKEAETPDEGFEEQSVVASEADQKQQNEVDWDAYIQGEAYDGGTGEGFVERPSLENTLSSAQSLYDHLEWQLNVTVTDEHKNSIGHTIISEISDEGILKTELAILAEDSHSTIEEMDEMLSIIQSFDPTGVGARDIKECLMLQAVAIEPDDTVIQDVILGHLDGIHERNYPKIAKDLNVDVERIIEAVEFIRTLDPAPGRAYGADRPEYVEPDLFVVKVDGEWQVYLNDDGIPTLKINNFYRNILKSKNKEKVAAEKQAASTALTVEGGEANSKDAKEREFVENKFQAALWLIKSIEQRRQTMLKVGRSLIKFQGGFLENGMSHLQPLVLRDVADDIEMHESTISRVTRNKYIHTPQGIYELKFFFHSGVSSYLGSSVSSVRVRDMIRKIVMEEDERKPATDDQLVVLLQTRDVKIARRTVTKYRKELGLPTASKRKKRY